MDGSKLVARVWWWFTVLVCNIIQITSAVSCNDRVITDACFINNNCSIGSGFLNEGIQLLIPWNFTCEGAITEWRARVRGNTSLVDDINIEFQIFQPDDLNTDTYNLVYGNPYHLNVSTQSSTLITSQVGIQTTSTTFIPIRPGYIVGVYLPPNTADQVLELLYSTADEGAGGNVDTVYYWTDVQNRTCQYSLCTGNVLKNVTILLEWEFVATSITASEIIVNQLRAQDPSYCRHQAFLVQECSTVMDVVTTSPLNAATTTTPTFSSVTSTSISMISLITTTTTSMSSPYNTLSLITTHQTMMHSPSPAVVNDTSSPPISSDQQSMLIIVILATALVVVLLIITITVASIVVTVIVWRKRRLRASNSEEDMNARPATDTKLGFELKVLNEVSCDVNPSYGEVNHHHYMSGRPRGRSQLMDDNEAEYETIEGDEPTVGQNVVYDSVI